MFQLPADETSPKDCMAFFHTSNISLISLSAVQLISFIGRGTFGDVFLMLNKMNLIRHAVKRIPLLPPAQAKALNVNWKFEAAKAQLLDSECVIPVQDFYSDEFHCFLAYDHLEDGTLRTFLDQREFPEKTYIQPV